LHSTDLKVSSNLNPGPADSVQQDPERSKSITSSIEQAVVLVVEDNVANFVLIARLLGYMGIHCEWKTSGYEVVEYADTLPQLDLILLDIRLPYEDGYAALRKIRSSSNLNSTRVVAVTAEASSEQMKKARSAGFDGFLGKPLDPDHFPDQVQRILLGDSVWELS
jgi:two-component system, cell cycle response regulator DivK